MLMQRSDAIRRINEYALSSTPFLFATDFEGLNTVVLTPAEAAEQSIFFTAGRMSNFSPIPWPAKRFTFIPHPVRMDVYRQAFEQVSWHLKRGDTYLINLTFPTCLETGISLKEVFHRSQAPFRLLFGEQFTVFSPEPFVSIREGIIRSNPMKGTIPADLNDAEARLLGDEKESFEHNTIVDLIRNDLSMVATDVMVNRFRYIERIRTNRTDLLQMSSEISGRLPANWRSRLGDILFTLLPAGSVSGAPKEKTVQIIKETEPLPRGFYTGVFGTFDGRELTSAVSIRFIEKTDAGLQFRSGGGITALSRCENEYQELIDKVYVPFV